MSSTAFADDAELLSSSASSSYISDGSVNARPLAQPAQPDSYPQKDAAATAPTPQEGIAGTSGFASRPNTTATTNGAGRERPNLSNPYTPKRFVDATDENTFPSNSGSKPSRGEASPKNTMKPSPKHNKRASPLSVVPQFGLANNATAFSEKIASSYFSCKICKRTAADPVQIFPEPPVLACRRCARVNVSSVNGSIRELPANIVAAMRDIVGRANMLRADPDPYAVADNEDLSEQPIARRRFFHVRRGHNNTNGVNHNNEDGTVASPMMTHLSSPDDLSRLLEQLVAAEASERQQLLSADISVRRGFERRKQALVAALPGAVPTSRRMKAEADRKYESAQYTEALELYTRAIQLQPVDQQTKLKFLYGNRSAAYFMAQRYADCTADCLEVVKRDPGNTKMILRAARSTATMGDLARAVSILENTPAEYTTEVMQAEHAKYKIGYELLQKAEKNFGSPEGDEHFRMLVAQFSDAIPLRVRYAESLMSQKQHLRAVEVLEIVSPNLRPPSLCYIMANALYLSGFEYFERARSCLSDAAQLDEGCANLLQLIDAVDDGKQKGNHLFAQKSFSAAVEHYNAAIKCASTNNQILRILYCNRAAANKELGRYREGVEDCTKAIEIDPEFCKAYARRARCHELLADHFAAVRDFKKALEFDSADRDLARELRAAEHGLAKEAEKEKEYYYQIGVSRNATEREIKLKYRELSLRWHPDKCIGLSEEERQRAERKFKVIGEAYGILMDPAKRREYDLKLDRERLTRHGGFGGFSSTYGGDYFRGNRHRAGPGGFW